MRATALWMVVAGAIFCAGCASPVVALRPFVADREAAIDPALAGSWAKDGDEPILVRLDGARYRIAVFEKNEVVWFHARLLRTGNAEILDLVIDDPSAFALPAHLPVRVWVEGDTLLYAIFNTAWIKDLARKELACEEESGMLIITATGERVARFLAAYGGDDRALESTESLQRVR